MPVTSTYGFPYPSPGDAPDGPTQMGNLANAVEDEMARVDLGIRHLGMRSSSTVNLTETTQVIPSTLSSFTTNFDNAIAIVTTTFDFQWPNPADAQNCTGALYVDGAEHTSLAIMRCVDNSRATVGQTYVITFAVPGVHSLGIRARCSATLTTGESPAQAIAPHTGWNAVLIDR